MMNKILHDKRHKQVLWYILLVLLLLSSVHCAYWYRQWQAWKTVNNRIFSYKTAMEWKDREDIIRKWQGTDEDALNVVQRQADACGLQVLSFYTSPQEKSRYNVELSGSYGSYIHFFNQMEREGPLFSISLERMERCGDAVLAVIKI
jgi:hypothetical protein